MNVTYYLYALAAMRCVLGLAPIVAAETSSRLLGFPTAHNNATARLMARMFGVRDIGLGAFVVAALGDPAALRNALAINLCMDAGDAVMIAVPLVRRQGLDRAAGVSLAFALTGGSCWAVALLLTRP